MTDDVYWWTIGTDTFGSEPRTFYVEGTQTGGREVRWQLRKSDGTTILARDTVEINVEMLVYPAGDQYTEDTNGIITSTVNTNWYNENTSKWEGFALPNTTYAAKEDFPVYVGDTVQGTVTIPAWTDAWSISKALVDYITDPGTKGSIATIQPDFEYNGSPVATQDGSDATTTSTYGDFTNGFTLEFDYAFDRSRGDGTNGWVGILARRNDTSVKYLEKLSFVANSGVKFGVASNGKPFEAAILDVESMVAVGGGLDAFDPAQGGYVKLEGEDGKIDTNGEYITESLNQISTMQRTL